MVKDGEGGKDDGLRETGNRVESKRKSGSGSLRHESSRKKEA